MIVEKIQKWVVLLAKGFLVSTLVYALTVIASAGVGPRHFSFS